MRKKHKRHSGYYTPQPTVPFKELTDDIFITPTYDDWLDHRDGFRDWYSDFKSIKQVNSASYRWSNLITKRLQMNEKQRRLIERRRARKSKLGKELT